MKDNKSNNIEDLNDKNIIESINYLINFKTKTPLKIIQNILDKREDVLPYLINVLETDRYWNLPWIPICVIHILSVIGGNQALQSIVQTIKKHYNDTGDWLTEEMSSILAQFGPEAFDTIIEMIRDRHLYMDKRRSIKISCNDCQK